MGISEAYALADKANAPAIYLRDNLEYVSSMLDGMAREARHVSEILSHVKEKLDTLPDAVHNAGLGSKAHTSDGFANLNEDELIGMRADVEQAVKQAKDDFVRILEVTADGNVTSILADGIKNASRCLEEELDKSLEA